MNKKVYTDKAPAAIGPYSQAIISGNLLFCSGMMPVDPHTNALVENDVAVQSKQIMENGDYYWERSDRGEKEIAKTRQQIANLILQGKKDFVRDSSYEKVLSNDKYRSIDGNKGKIYKDPHIVRDRLSSRNPEPHIKGLINGFLIKQQKEIEKEIEQYLGRDKGYGMSL